jgi:hypothetical protein
MQNGKQDSVILTLKPRKGSCVDNLAQALLAALDNAEGEGKIGIDAAIKETIRLEIESAVNQIMAHDYHCASTIRRSRSSDLSQTTYQELPKHYKCCCIFLWRV